MNFWIKIALGLVGAGAVIGVWYGDEYYTKKEEETKKISSKVLNFEAAQVRKFVLTNSAGTFTFEREQATTPWKMTAPKAVKPDQDTVNNLLASVQGLTLETELAGTEKAAKGGAEAATYGLGSPRATLEITLEDKKNLKLSLGQDVSVGNTSGANFNALSVYAVSSSREAILVVGSSVISATKKTYTDFRTKIAGDFSTTDVKSLVVTKANGDKVKVDKAEKGWNIVAPRDLPADSNNVGLFLDRLARLKVDKVTESEALNPSNLAALGLDMPATTLEIIGEGNKSLQVFKLGLTKESAYVTMADGAVGSVELSQWADLSPELKYFRDRRVMRGVSLGEVSKIKTLSGKVFQKEGPNWYPVGVAAPVASPAAGGATKAEKVSDKDASQLFSDWEFLTADDVVDGAEAADLSKFGLDKPVTRFSLEYADASKPATEVLVGGRVPKNEKAVFVKRVDAPEVYAVETGWLDVLARMDGAGQSPQAQK